MYTLMYNLFVNIQNCIDNKKEDIQVEKYWLARLIEKVILLKKRQGFRSVERSGDAWREPAGKGLHFSRGLMPEACSLRAQRATVIEWAGQMWPDAIAKRGSYEERKIGWEA